MPFDRTVTTGSESERSQQTTTTVLTGASFDDLTVPQQKAVLAEAGADAVVVVRVVIGAHHGAWQGQNVEVMAKLAVDSGATMAWASRCNADSGAFANVSAALEHATRCAIQGATGRPQ